MEQPKRKPAKTQDDVYSDAGRVRGPGPDLVFGYVWETIKAAQQGVPLTRPLNGPRTVSVECFRCGKYFKLPNDTTDQDPFPMDQDLFPVQCTHCGYLHTSHDAKSANWPMLLP